MNYSGANAETDHTSNGLASLDLMYLAYTMARIRPIVQDTFVVQRLKDVQRIKGQDLGVVLLQLWLSGLTGLAESNTDTQRKIWRSMVSVKIPSIILKLGLGQEVYDTVEFTLQQLSFYRGLLSECDEGLAEDSPADSVDILKAIALGCLSTGIIRADKLDILQGITLSRGIMAEFQYIGSSNLELIDELCGRTLIDFENQEKLVDRIIQICGEASSKNDVVTLSKLCQTLDDNPLVLDIIHFLRSPSELLVPLESFVNNLQQNEDDDIDTCNLNLEGFGNVLILIMTIIRRYDFSGCLDSILREKQGFCYIWLHRTSATIPASSITSINPDMQVLMGNWIAALFDSMGISDDLIQTSKPQMLLEISPSIFEQSLAACQAGVIDTTTLNSGLDYFLQPCLLFVLIGVVQYLCEEILFSSTSTAVSVMTQTSGQSVPASGNSMLSPGYAISPLVSRGGKHQSHVNSASSTGIHGHGLGKSVASIAMFQSSLKSLLAGEAFPLRLMRLLKNEITAALQHQAMENDHQLAIIQERLATASLNYYSWSVSESYDVVKLAQQTSLSFESIVSGGRTSLLLKKEKGWPVFGGTCYHIDVDLFRSMLSYLGPDQYVSTILKQLLEAALTQGGWRAVELGAAMMTTPLISNGDQYLAPQNLLWTLIYRTLWIPVPGKLETFSQGKLMAAFVGMTLDLFQSESLIQLREKQSQEGYSQPQPTDIEKLDGKRLPLTLLERDTAVEPLRVILDQRIKALEQIAKDRPGFEGFAQGMEQYRQRHPPLSLPLKRSKVAHQE